jgi:hypothetical protein
MAEQLCFTENKGQLEERVKYYSKLPNQNVILLKNGFAYDNFKWKGDSIFHHRVEIMFKSANNNSTFQCSDQSTYYENYYQKNKEVINVRGYGEVVNKNIYPGINVKYTFNENGFKYDLILHPGSRLDNVVFKVLGAPVKIEGRELIYSINTGNLKELIPLSFLKESGKKVEVRYDQKCLNEIGFIADEFALNQTLIIDPVPKLVWGTYVGDNGHEEFFSSDLDTLGNIYSGGTCTSVYV